MLKFNSKRDAHDHESLYWLTGIKVDKDNPRLHLRCVEIKGADATGTDGRMLLTAKIDPMIEDGTYEVAKRTKTEIQLVKVEDVEFPAWEELFETNIEDTKGGFDLACTPEGGNFSGFARLIRAVETVAFNYNLFNTLTSVDKVFGVLVNEDETRPVVFLSDDKRALLMPIRGEHGKF